MQSAVESANVTQVTDIEAWSELERELAVRGRIFDKWVKEGKLSWADARDRYARLKRAALILKAVVDDTDQMNSINTTPLAAAQ